MTRLSSAKAVASLHTWVTGEAITSALAPGGALQVPEGSGVPRGAALGDGEEGLGEDREFSGKILKS